MTEDQSTQPKEGAVTSAKNDDTAEVTFGGKTYTIKRLKAGKFYQALKVYMSMVREVTPKNASDKDEAQVDLNQLVSSMFESWPEKMAEFVAICCTSADVAGDEKPSNEFILENAYPEEITTAFQTCLKLNKVTDSLKNFVAPIEELGAVAQNNKDK